MLQMTTRIGKRHDKLTQARGNVWHMAARARGTANRGHDHGNSDVVDVEGQRRRLRQAVDQSGKSDAAISKEAGLTPNYVHNFTKDDARGKRGMSYRDAKRLAKVLAVSPLWLLEGEATVFESRGVDGRTRPPHHGAGGQAAADEGPAREEALVILGPYLDARTKELLLRRRGPSYERYDVDDWLREAKELQLKIKGVDREWEESDGLATVAPARAKPTKPGPGRGKTSS
jgi:transcriptional regulator with XRE-family HTH domain